MKRQKRVLAVHDISGLGRCSLTVALPIISACGIETAILPTAILSTHTGGFTGYTYRDLTEDIMPITEHWAALDIFFDAIYSGFLGSFAQLEMMQQLFEGYKAKGSLIVVDPVLGDNGVLYSLFSPSFVEGMRELCKTADIITPNLTEATLLTGMEYCPDCEPAYIKELLYALGNYTGRYAVLTGVKNQDELGVAVYDKSTGEICLASNTQVDGLYHGTGDVFASALVGAHMRGKNVQQAAKIAVDYTLESILRTKELGTDYKYGVDFEEAIPALLQLINE